MGFLKDGKIKEMAFASDLVKRYGGGVRFASAKDDIGKHIDVYWDAPNGGTYGIDIKGARKNKRTDKCVDYSIHWVELRNVNGRKGWLFGKADLFAFEGERDWIIVPRKTLQDLIKGINPHTDRVRLSTPKLYEYYQREGRKDLLIKVATLDLMRAARVIIPRDLCGNITIK